MLCVCQCDVAVWYPHNVRGRAVCCPGARGSRPPIALHRPHFGGALPPGPRQRRHHPPQHEEVPGKLAFVFQSLGHFGFNTSVK